MKKSLQRSTITLLLALICACIGSLSCGGSSAGGSGVPDSDSDGDGISDADEVVLGTDPNDADSDDDGLDDGEEFQRQTDPMNGDTDFDQLGDGFEVDLGTNPRIADPVTSLTGTVAFLDSQPAAGADLKLENAALQGTYPGVFATAEGNGGFSFAQAWPTSKGTGTFVSATGVRDGAPYSARRELPALNSGLLLLPLLELEFQPYTRGKDFFVTIPQLLECGSCGFKQIAVMAIINPGSIEATVQWRSPGVPSGVSGAQGVVHLPAGTSTAITLPAEELRHSQEFCAGSIETASRGVRVTSDLPVAVAVQTYLDLLDKDMAAYSCLPTSSYGTNYFLQSVGDSAAGCFFGVFGAYALATAGKGDVLPTLTLTEPMDIFGNGSSAFIAPGVPTAVSIEFEDSLQLIGNVNLTGSRLTASTPFGVLAGTTSIHNSELQGNGGAKLLETLAPTTQWGTSFVSFGSLGDVDGALYICAGQDGASVSIGGAAPIPMLGGGQLTVALPLNDATSINSDEPILVWQTIGWEFTGAAGINLAPTSRWSTHEVLWSFSAPSIENFIATLAPNDSLDEVLLDGQSVRSLPQLQESAVNGQFSILTVPVAGGSHRIESPSPIFPMALGRAPHFPNGGLYFAYAYSTVW